MPITPGPHSLDDGASEVRVGQIVVLEGTELVVGPCVPGNQFLVLQLFVVVLGNGLLICKNSHQEFARLECVQHFLHKFHVVLLWNITLKADIGTVRLRGYVDRDVITPWQKTIHGIPTWIKQEVVNLGAWNYVTNSRFLGCLWSIFTHFFGKYLHSVWTHFPHQKFHCLVRFHNSHSIHGVQVPVEGKD